MDNDKPEVIKAMLDILYKGNYKTGYTSMEDLMMNLHVYALADRVQIANLKERAESHISILMHSCWNQDGFYEAVQFAYSIAPPREKGDALRRTVLKACARHAKALFEDPDNKFESLVESLPEFAMDLLKWQATHLQPIEYGGSALFGGGGSGQR